MAYKQPYRGTRKSKRNGVLLALTLVFMLLVAGVVIFYAAQEYLVFSADGFRFVFRSPTTVPPSQPEAGTPPTVIFEGTEPAATTAPATEPPATQPPARREGLTRAAMAAGPDDDLPLPEGAERPAVYIQNADGLARIPTEAYGEPADEGQLAMADWLSGRGGVGVLSVFRNHEGAARARASALTVESGKTWLDAGNIRWLSPYALESGAGGPAAPDVADHLFASAAEIGLGEIVLTNLQFPTAGQLGLIYYGTRAHTAQSRFEAIEAQAAALRQRFDRYSPDVTPMLLSCLLTPTAALHFSDPDAGQDAAALAEYFDILYVATADPDFDVDPLYALLEGTGCRIGLWLSGTAAPGREIDFILVP